MSDETYYLVMHRWVNGNNRNTQLGNKLAMLNTWGRSCCLGQFAQQKGVDAETLTDKTSPRSVYCDLRENYDTNFLTVRGREGIVHTKLAADLMEINDSEDPLMSGSERAKKIKARMKKDGLELIITHSNY